MPQSFDRHFEQVLRQVWAKYVLGLTATRVRKDVAQAVANGRSHLVLSGRTDHVEWLGARLRKHIERVSVTEVESN
jgi:hypothetical protein